MNIKMMKTKHVGQNSECNRQRTKSESNTSSRAAQNSNQEFSSIENLEDLLTCPIHLGVVDEPRQLLCGHTFCLSCLENYVNHSGEPSSKNICCPLCRNTTQIDHRGIRSLAPSFLHKQLTEYLFSKKQRVLKLTSEQYDERLTSNDPWFENKVQLLNQLLNDLNSKDSSLVDFSSYSNNNSLLNLNSILNKPEIHGASRKARVRSKSVVLPVKSDIDEKINLMQLKCFDQDTICKNMRKYREYTMINQFSLHTETAIIGIARTNSVSSFENLTNQISMVYIVQNDPMIYLVNFQGSDFHSFTVNVENANLLPVYIKCRSNVIFISGKVGLFEKSCLIQVSFSGVKEKSSRIYSGCFGGFCFDLSTNSIFIAYPTKNRVLLIDETLKHKLKVFKFGSLSPMYVAISATTHEIWVSCPENCQIAVYDEEAENYLHLATSQIYGSIPTHIIETNDQRLLFLDVDKSRIFWIFRWNNCLYIQVLLLMNIPDDFQITTIESTSNNTILLSNGKKTIVFKPDRSPKEEHQKIKCLIL